MEWLKKQNLFSKIVFQEAIGARLPSELQEMQGEIRKRLQVPPENQRR